MAFVKRCPECGSIKLLLNQDKGEVICRDCGLVIEDKMVDFDQEYGHRNDSAGFGRALEAFDRALPGLLAALPPESRLVITADHGNDPTHPGTDHTREYVPLLVVDPSRSTGRALGSRGTFADHAASLAAGFGVPFECPGTSFL